PQVRVFGFTEKAGGGVTTGGGVGFTGETGGTVAAGVHTVDPGVIEAPSVLIRTVQDESLQQTPSSPQKPHVKPLAQPPPALSSQQTSPDGTAPPPEQHTSLTLL
ncbi:hypothetical protein LTR80_012068, partial [Exophiala xenobiotica]